MYSYDRAAIRNLLTHQGRTITNLFHALVRAGYEGGRGPILDCVNGKIVPDADRIALIATVLEVPPATFFFGGPVGVGLRVRSARVDEPVHEPAPGSDDLAVGPRSAIYAPGDTDDASAAPAAGTDLDDAP